MSICCRFLRFSRVNRTVQTHEKLIKDLQIVTDWAHQWKMVFNPDITKQAIEVKKNKPEHPKLIFNGIPVFHEFIIMLVVAVSLHE